MATRIVFHGVAGILCDDADAMGDWPSEVKGLVATEARLGALWEATHNPVIVSAIRALMDAGIESVVMKGTALAYSLYEDAALRRRGDSDLLVKPNDLMCAREALRSAGLAQDTAQFGPNFQEVWEYESAAGMTHLIDLHWQPVDSPFILKLVDCDQIWSQKVALDRLCIGAYVPDPVITLVRGAINEAWHLKYGYYADGPRLTGGHRMIWAVDYLLLTEKFSALDWENLSTYCEKTGASPIVLSALEGAETMLGMALPDTVRSRLTQQATPSPQQRYISSFGELARLRADVFASTDTAMALAVMRCAAFAPREHLLRKFPKSDHWPTFALQLRRYAATMTKTISKG
ncbi:hypothetical protein MTsPCn3_06870 [Erythrobacter sp. MTPC3]